MPNEHPDLRENQPSDGEQADDSSTGTENTTAASAPTERIQSSLSTIDIEINENGKPTVFCYTSGSRTRAELLSASDAVDYLPEEPPWPAVLNGIVRVILRANSQPTAWNMAQKMAGDVPIQEGIMKHALNLQTQRFSLRNLQTLCTRNTGVAVRPLVPDSPSRVAESRTQSTFLLQAPISKYVLPKEAVIDDSQGPHPLLSAKWHFSKMLEEDSISLYDSGATVQFQRRPDGRYVVLCNFPALASVNTQAQTKALSPMLHDLKDLLLSSESALNLVDWANANKDRGNKTYLVSQVVLLDLMRVTLRLWESFDLAVNARTSPRTEIKTGKEVLSLLQHDIIQSQRLVATMRDFQACFNFLLQSMSSSGATSGYTYVKSVREMRGRIESMQDRLKDLAEQAAQNMAVYQVCLSETESEYANNFRRAMAVFFPLNLAVSLVSLSTGILGFGESWTDRTSLGLGLSMVLFLLYTSVSFFGLLETRRNDEAQKSSFWKFLEEKLKTLDAEKITNLLPYSFYIILFFVTLPENGSRLLWNFIAGIGLLELFRANRARQQKAAAKP